MSKKCEVTLQIPFSKKTLKHIEKARAELMKAGVTFDSGVDIKEKIMDWELDWSLKGANTRCKKA